MCCLLAAVCLQVAQLLSQLEHLNLQRAALFLSTAEQSALGKQVLAQLSVLASELLGCLCRGTLGGQSQLGLLGQSRRETAEFSLERGVLTMQMLFAVLSLLEGRLQLFVDQTQLLETRLLRSAFLLAVL